ncbi:triphosphoribosyl-dephospho-CoA synthase [Labilibaculum sp.]|uniref:triphosphoribosyl-dephospho-CoA synthase n=1 Tax=Labilibaculum sp. TaxID=2060723 RepID=UPI003563E074
MEIVVKNILKAKESRAQERLMMAGEGDYSISLTVNIPGIPKSNELIHSFFEECLSDLKRFLLSHRIVIDPESEINRSDAAGDFYLVSVPNQKISADNLKEISEQFESEHSLGRLLDVDITDEKGNPISSGKAKNCYFCNQHPAVYCMRMQTHEFAEMRQIIEQDLTIFLESRRKNRLCKDLSAFALKALLHEVALSPKPGLVDRFSNGSHSDMDFTVFLNSSAVISVYFKEIAEFGFDFSSANSREALPKLRQIGLQMEEDMFSETNDVNTHKGAIFLIGFSLFSCAYLIKNRNFSYLSFVHLIKELNGDLVENELGKKLYSNKKTHGEVCFEKFGEKGKGIRGEIQAGLPCVFKYAIPVLTSYFENTKCETDEFIQKGLTQTLLVLIAHNKDSNILYRKGENVLEELQSLALEAFHKHEGESFQLSYQKLIDYCQKTSISPGGSADLLAVSYFIFMVNKKYKSMAISTNQN